MLPQPCAGDQIRRHQNRHQLLHIQPCPGRPEAFVTVSNEGPSYSLGGVEPQFLPNALGPLAILNMRKGTR
ncbi:hypothetical protein M758_UG260000 [Ceratodon purpureus]|nr:hypothetical protein M758_UG260000 [Ceratodon purpureus]